MKLLRDLVSENCSFPVSNKELTIMFETEIKNYELFSDSELKAYFNSEVFLKDLHGCLEKFHIAEDEGLFQFFIIRQLEDSIHILLDAFSIPD